MRHWWCYPKNIKEWAPAFRVYFFCVNIDQQIGSFGATKKWKKEFGHTYHGLENTIVCVHSNIYP